MSRVGRQPIPIPPGTKVELAGNMLSAQGPLGNLSLPVFRECPIAIEDGVIRISRINDSGPVRAKHGLLRALIANALHGVKEGFTRQLDLVGVGYRGEVKERQVQFSLGYSHPVVYKIPDGISVEIDKSNRITIKGRDRQQVGQVAAEIRSLRPPDSYKGKGIRYTNEVIRLKVGKAGGK